MREIEYKSSFDKAYKKLHPQEKIKVKEAIDRFLSVLQEGGIPVGLGLKKIDTAIWEIRIDLSLRIVFRIRKNIVEFGMIGNHEDVRRYLKNF